MPRKKANIHYIYKTTCLVTGRYYIGMHSTSNLEDGYLGSGKRLRYSLRKYGKENHIKEILEFFDSRESLIEAEKQIVNSELIQDDNCMNLKEGGMGGFVNKDHMLKATMAGGKALKNKLLNDNDFKLYWSNLTSSQMKIRHKMGLVKYDNFKGKIHSKETKAKMSESSKGIGIGKNNSQYGTCWITNGVKNKKIKKEEIDIYLKTGWFKGRKT